MKNYVSIAMMFLMHPSAKECIAAELRTNAPHSLLGALASKKRCVTGDRNEYVTIQTSTFLESPVTRKLYHVKRDYSIQPIIRCNVFHIRGGDSRELQKCAFGEDYDTKDVVLGQELIGIADLRQTPEADCIVLAQIHDETKKTIAEDDRDNIHSEFLDKALFPSVSSDTNDSTSDYNMDQQAAAASLTIGSSCSTVYLLVSYDFKHGKTVLHRTLGGIKLMSLVDGVRKRWHEASSSKPASTKLVLLLVPYISANNGKTEESCIEVHSPEQTFYEISQHSEWRNDGANFLIDRLKTYFELGGEEYIGAHPFSDLSVIRVTDTKMQAPPSGTNQDNQYDPNIRLDIVLRHNHLYAKNRTNAEVVKSVSTQTFRRLIVRKFKSFGGIGDLVFL
ncbi:hypothetical protein ACHAW6_016171 [Cyclotella cf. meneghiniana]